MIVHVMQYAQFSVKGDDIEIITPNTTFTVDNVYSWYRDVFLKGTPYEETIAHGQLKHDGLRTGDVIDCSDDVGAKLIAGDPIAFKEYTGKGLE